VASFLARFFGRTVSEGAAFAMGVAIGPALSPAVRVLVNEAWNKYPTMPLQAVELAQGVASGQVDREWAVNEAQNTGISVDRFAHLIRIFDTGPGVEQAYRLWHRGILNEAGFRRACKREALEPEWIDALVAARQTLLTPSELANARQQGYIQQQRQYDEAEKWGVDNERAELQFLLSGLPPGPETGLDMLRRGIITEAEFGDLVREGHTKTKYIDELLALRHPILSASQATQLRLKGWIEAPAQHAIGALSGYTPAQMDQLFLAAGRPAAPGQMATAAVRGIDGPDGVPMNKAQFLKGIAESDIRPEWGPMIWASRFLYPSLFQLTRLVTSGAIPADVGAQWAHKARYAPEVVTALRESWGGAQAPTRDPHVVKAENQLWTTQHTSYKAGESDAAEAETTLDMLNVPQGVHGRILALWNRERDIARKQLTPTQLKKAWKAKVTNPATGAAWSREEALARLESMGYAPADAETFLDE
jgi:hypothetical protein